MYDESMLYPGGQRDPFASPLTAIAVIEGGLPEITPADQRAVLQAWEVLI